MNFVKLMGILLTQVALLFALLGCSPKPFNIRDAKLTLGEYHDASNFSTVDARTYLLFTFKSDLPLDEIGPSESLLQTRIQFIKEKKVVREEAGSGPKGWKFESKRIISLPGASSYVSLCFMNLTSYAGGIEERVPLVNIDFDTLFFYVRYVNMPGVEAESNRITFTRKKIESILKNEIVPVQGIVLK